MMASVDACCLAQKKLLKLFFVLPKRRRRVRIRRKKFFRRCFPFSDRLWHNRWNHLLWRNSGKKIREQEKEEHLNEIDWIDKKLDQILKIGSAFQLSFEKQCWKLGLRLSSQSKLVYSGGLRCGSMLVKLMDSYSTGCTGSGFHCWWLKTAIAAASRSRATSWGLTVQARRGQSM